MRIISSIVAVVVLVGLFPAIQIWKAVDPQFYDRREILQTLMTVFIFSGAIAAFLAIILASDRKPIAMGFGVYAMLHGSWFLHLTWGAGDRPGWYHILAGLAICVGLRAVMMLCKRHEQVDAHQKETS
jgi:hypothetical protein